MLRFVSTLGFVLFYVALPGSASAQTAEFDFIAVDTTLLYDPATGTGGGTVSLFIHEHETPGSPHNVQGWSLGLAHDPTVITPTLIASGEYMLEILPDFWQPTILPDGITVGAVYSFLGLTICTYEVAKEIAVVTYETVPGALAGDPDGEVTTLEYTDGLGDPGVLNVVVVGGSSIPPDFIDGTVDLITGVPFRRGDANADGLFDIADPIFALSALFVPGSPPHPCDDAADANDDGTVDVADPVYALNAALLPGSPPPPTPFLSCGPDPTGDLLGCRQYDSCP